MASLSCFSITAREGDRDEHVSGRTHAAAEKEKEAKTLEGAEGPALVVVGLPEAFGKRGVGHVQARRRLVLRELQQVRDVDAPLAPSRLLLLPLPLPLPLPTSSETNMHATQHTGGGTTIYGSWCRRQGAAG
jgi:hypothetical protein